MKYILTVLKVLLLSGLHVFANDTIQVPSNQFFIDHSRKIVLTNLSVDYINATWTDTKTYVHLDEVYAFFPPIEHIDRGLEYKIIPPNNVNIYALYFTELPIIHITTSETIVDEPNVMANFKMIESNQNYIESFVGIQYRGGFSQSYPKKSMEIEFHTDETAEDNVDYPLLGMRAEDKWNLQAMYNEPLRMRNKTNFELWRLINQLHYIQDEPQAINGVRMEYAEVFINNSYYGIYGVGEKINRKQLRLKNHNGQIRGELYKGDDWGITTFEGDLIPYSNYSDTWGGFEYKHPDEEIDWSNLYNFADFVMNAPNEVFYENYASKFSQDNLVDYFIFLNLLKMNDNTGKNLYIAKYTKDDVYFYVPWDLDGTFGIRYDGTQGSSNGKLENGFYKRLWHDCAENGFYDKLNQKWHQLRNSTLTHYQLLAMFRQNHDYLYHNGAYNREQLAWPDYEYSSDHLDYISQWIDNRLNYLDVLFTQPCLSLAVAEIEMNANNYDVFPNPAKQNVSVISKEGLPFSIQLYNNLGQLVKEQEMSTGSMQLSLDQINSGIYFLKISDEMHQETHKIIIE